jgi:thiamine pyrophosphate-dependent acetolactate synthase large subunit-like protein
VIVKNNRKVPDTDGGKSKRLAMARFHQGVEIGPLATALGAKAHRVEKPTELAGTLKKAIADVRGGRTTVVEVVTQRINGSLHHLWDPAAAKGRNEALG